MFNSLEELRKAVCPKALDWTTVSSPIWQNKVTGHDFYGNPLTSPRQIGQTVQVWFKDADSPKDSFNAGYGEYTESFK